VEASRTDWKTYWRSSSATENVPLSGRSCHDEFAGHGTQDLYPDFCNGEASARWCCHHQPRLGDGASAAESFLEFFPIGWTAARHDYRAVLAFFLIPLWILAPTAGAWFWARS